MAVAAVSPTKPQWRAVLRPKWLCWHAFAVVAFLGMLWLGDWQWHCALSGNTLSWAYTFEWPLFAIFGVVFWVRTVRDEVGLTAIRAARKSAAAGDAGASAAGASAADVIAADVIATDVSATAVVAADVSARAGASDLLTTAAPSATSEPDAATSTGRPGDDDAGLTRSHRRESESQEDYAARLIAEIRRPDRGKWRVLR
jgi:hypothetical protein